MKGHKLEMRSFRVLGLQLKKRVRGGRVKGRKLQSISLGGGGGVTSYCKRRVRGGRVKGQKLTMLSCRGVNKMKLMSCRVVNL